MNPGETKQLEEFGARIRAVFRERPDEHDDSPADDDLETVWRAASGELNRRELEALVERVRSEPALAEAWRMARQIRSDALGEERHVVRASDRLGKAARSSPIWWLAAAASIILLFFLWPNAIDHDVPLRTQETDEVRTLTPEDEPADRTNLELRWTEPERAVGYDVKLTGPDFEPLHRCSRIQEPPCRIPDSALAELPSGSELHWQVTVVYDDGSMEFSPTFLLTLR